MNKSIRLSYAILACNEHEELNNLLELLFKNIDTKLDEIVLVLDKYNTTKEVTDVIIRNNRPIVQDIGFFKIYEHPLNKDFASQKNFLKSKCTGDYIIQLDADELVTDYFLNNIKAVLTMNPSIDIFYVPRLNKVHNITLKHVQMWNWRIDDRGYINFPDYQMRIMKNIPEIKWERKVHEILVGQTTYSNLPTLDEWCIIHNKDIIKQEKQNEFYSKI